MQYSFISLLKAFAAVLITNSHMGRFISTIFFISWWSNWKYHFLFSFRFLYIK